MNQHRSERVSDIIKGLAARFLELESNRSSIITVTDVQVSNNEKEAMIFFTVFPDSAEGVVLEFAKRRRSDFKHFVMDNSRLGRIPFFDFAIDFGEKNRQRIEELSIQSGVSANEKTPGSESNLS
jgi:ribosome-binding factor A